MFDDVADLAVPVEKVAELPGPHRAHLGEMLAIGYVLVQVPIAAWPVLRRLASLVDSTVLLISALWAISSCLKSAALRAILKQVETVAPTDSNVILYGETGTGKELVARAIHSLSGRRQGTFVKLNCAAIPTGLLESEMFGHEKGTFIGAIAQRIGRFELAHRGTVFLDEVGEIPLELRPSCYAYCREFERLGSSRTIRTDARVIAATNRDLACMVRDHQFRSDLYYRVNVFPITVPPLRERPEDIPLARPLFRAAVCTAYEQDRNHNSGRRNAGLGTVFMAGEYPRVAEPCGTRRDHLIQPGSRDSRAGNGTKRRNYGIRGRHARLSGCDYLGVSGTRGNSTSLAALGGARRRAKWRCGRTRLETDHSASQNAQARH